MRSFQALVFGSFVALSTAVVSAASLSMPRQIQSPGAGIIVAPTTGTTVQSGASYDFEFDAFNVCEDGYLTFDVYLLANLDPAFSDLNAEGQFTDYLFNYGNFTIANFGLPADMGTPPPAALTMPALDVSSGEISLAIVTIDTNCPADIPVEYGLTSTIITYDA